MPGFKITSDTPLVAERRTADIVALYVGFGATDDVRAVERAVNAYARKYLGTSGPVSTGGSFRADFGGSVQMIYVMGGPNRPDRFQHGQHVIYYPEWDQAGEHGEEMIIEEVIDPDTHIAVRPLNSDAVFTVNPSRLSSPFGAPCACRTDDSVFPC